MRFKINEDRFRKEHDLRLECHKVIFWLSLLFVPILIISLFTYHLNKVFLFLLIFGIVGTSMIVIAFCDSLYLKIVFKNKYTDSLSIHKNELRYCNREIIKRGIFKPKEIKKYYYVAKIIDYYDINDSRVYIHGCIHRKSGVNGKKIDVLHELEFPNHFDQQDVLIEFLDRQCSRYFCD